MQRTNTDFIELKNLDVEAGTGISNKRDSLLVCSNLNHASVQEVMSSVGDSTGFGAPSSCDLKTRHRLDTPLSSNQDIYASKISFCKERDTWYVCWSMLLPERYERNIDIAC